jgi:DNA polymerase type B, organellar and viral
LDHPILQSPKAGSIKTVNGLRTIAGLGSWEGWIFSEEMDNAKKFGYEFEILKGYQFEKADIFSGYVNKMYNLRLQYPKGEAMNLIAKLLMNSL